MTRAEQYQGNIGNKFHADGSVRSFAGNTVISFINHAEPIFALFWPGAFHAAGNQRRRLLHVFAG